MKYISKEMLKRTKTFRIFNTCVDRFCAFYISCCEINCNYIGALFEILGLKV